MPQAPGGPGVSASVAAGSCNSILHIIWLTCASYLTSPCTEPCVYMTRTPSRMPEADVMPAVHLTTPIGQNAHLPLHDQDHF